MQTVDPITRSRHRRSRGDRSVWSGQGRPEIDDHLEFGRLHDRQIGGLLALENSPDVDAHLPPGVG
jgi:hypothetical protein